MKFMHLPVNHARLGKIIGLAVIPAFSLVLSCLVAVQTFSWMSTNKKVDNGGMDMEISSSSDLIISKNKEDVTDFSGNNAPDYFSVSFSSDEDIELEPAMHRDADDTLVVADQNNVNPVSGLGDSSSTMTYSSAVENVNYIQYVTYVGVASSSMTYTNFKLQIDSAKCFAECGEEETAVAGVTYYQRSGNTFSEITLTTGAGAKGYYTSFADTSMDVYSTVSVDVLLDDTYRATLLPSGTSAGDTEVVLSASGTLSTSSPCKVTLLVYFDGAMADPDDTRGYTILRAGNQQINKIYLGFSFSLEGESD